MPGAGPRTAWQVRGRRIVRARRRQDPTRVPVPGCGRGMHARAMAQRRLGARCVARGPSLAGSVAQAVALTNVRAFPGPTGRRPAGRRWTRRRAVPWGLPCMFCPAGSVSPVRVSTNVEAPPASAGGVFSTVVRLLLGRCCVRSTEASLSTHRVAAPHRRTWLGCCLNVDRPEPKPTTSPRAPPRGARGVSRLPALRPESTCGSSVTACDPWRCAHWSPIALRRALDMSHL